MDYNARIKAIQTYLSESRLSAFLVLAKVNRQYLSGFTGSSGVVLIPRQGKAVLYIDDRYLIRARKESQLPVKRFEILSSAIDELRMTKRVGIEDRITLRELKWLKKMGGKNFQVTSNIVENLRAVKTAHELQAIKKGQKIIDRLFRHLKKFVRPGLTETAVTLELERVAKKLSADGLAFEPIVAWGPNAAAPHHLSGMTKIRKNNFLLLDFGVLVGGYHTDFTRTLFFGRPNNRQEKVYNTVLQAQKMAIAGIYPGVKAYIVHALARGYITAHKFGKYFTHNTGHGAGLEIHELPNFAKDSEDVLRPNMVVTVEPGVYIEKWGGVRIEDMVYVTPRGGKVLSKIPKDLKAMIIR